MSEEQINKDFIAWAGKTWWELPESVRDHMQSYIADRRLAKKKEEDDS